MGRHSTKQGDSASAPEQSRWRATGWTLSFLLHGILLATVLVLQHGTIPEREPEPEPLVFVEPAPPPPPLARLEGATEAKQDSGAVEPESLPEPGQEERLVVPSTTTPKPTRTARPRATTSPTSPRRRDSEPTPAAASTSGDEAAPPGARPASEGGVEGGVAGGVPGGKLGGVVGGSGDEVIGAAVAAQPPVVVTRAVPEYPARAREERIEGSVLLQAVVSREGRVEEPILVLRSVPGLDDAAIAALRQWRFSPGRDRNNQPVRVRIEVPMRFQLR